MPEERAEIRIPLPRHPVLRALALFGVGSLLALMSIPALLRALALPAWLGAVAVLLIIFAIPVVGVGAWLRNRRRDV